MQISDSNKYGATDRTAIQKFAGKYGIRIPPDFHDHLLKHNGGSPSPSDFNTSDNTSKVHGGFHGLHSGPEYLRLDKRFEAFSERIPPSLLPIASDAFGNQVCIGLSEDRFGRIYFWDHEMGGENGLEPISSTFSGFLEMLYRWVDPTLSKADAAIKNGSIAELREIISDGYQIETKDENGRTLMERASIQGQNEVIEFLWGLGAKPGKSLEIAEKNAKYFEGHKATVALLKKLLDAWLKAG